MDLKIQQKIFTFQEVGIFRPPPKKYPPSLLRRGGFLSDFLNPSVVFAVVFYVNAYF